MRVGVEVGGTMFAPMGRPIGGRDETYRKRKPPKESVGDLLARALQHKTPDDVDELARVFREHYEKQYGQAEQKRSGPGGGEKE